MQPIPLILFLVKLKNIDLQSFQLLSWEAMKYANFSVADDSLVKIENWITSYFDNVLGCLDGDFELGIYAENTGTNLDKMVDPLIATKKDTRKLSVFLK